MCFPEKLKETLNIRLIAYNDIWPFNNVAYHFGEKIISEYRMNKVIMKTVLLLYTCPFDILLQYTRTAYNYSFAKYSNVIQQRYIKWTCNQMNSLDQLDNTSYALADRHLDTLHLQFFKMEVGII
jgi:hypothetical protein